MREINKFEEKLKEKQVGSDGYGGGWNLGFERIWGFLKCEEEREFSGFRRENDKTF